MTSAPNTSTATTPIHAAIAGEALIDLIRRPDGSYLPCLGGALYNPVSYTHLTLPTNREV